MSIEEKSEETSWRTHNVRLSDTMIREIDELKARFNLDLGLSNFGHTYTRSDVIRAVIKNGIEATKAMLTPPPSPQPLEPKDEPGT